MLINILKAKVTDMQREYMKFRKEHAIDLMFIWFVMYTQPIFIYLNLKFWLWFCLWIRKKTDNETFRKIAGWSMYYFLYFAPFFLLFYLIAKYARYL